MNTLSRPGSLFLSSSVRSSLYLLGAALFCLLFADMEITTRTPWNELARMGQGLLHPQLIPWTELLHAVGQTLSYALLAVAASALIGFGLSFHYQHWWVRIPCAIFRSVHELFWGLLFIQLVGIHPLSGFLAIALPFSGIFAKVYAEILEEQQQHLSSAIPPASDALSRFAYGHWPLVLRHFANYTQYRLECGLRSSAVLGFIGIPTLGFYLESAFMQGLYGQAAGILMVFYGLIASMRHWLKPRLIPLYLVLSLVYLWPQQGIDLSMLTRLANDVIPTPLRTGADLWPWLNALVSQQLLPGIANTLIVTQLALVVAAVLGLLCFPLVSTQFSPLPVRLLGHAALVIFRSTPELIIAFCCLLVWGPSMLPAVLALGIHNGAIIGHLIGRHSNQQSLRLDASVGLNRYSFEILPRLYGQFLAFLCYRWEVILRESAILGILGVHTLGFYIDSAFESFRLDVAIILIAVTAMLNIGIDQLSRWTRHQLHLRSSPEARTPC